MPVFVVFQEYKTRKSAQRVSVNHTRVILTISAPLVKLFLFVRNQLSVVSCQQNGHSEPVTDVTGVRIPEIGASRNDALRMAL